MAGGETVVSELGPAAQHSLPHRACRREFRVAARYFRCCGYVLAGGVLCILLVCLGPARVGPNQPAVLDHVSALFAMLIAAPAIALVYLSNWRLRIDEQGVARQRFGLWTCWSWEAMERGDVALQVNGTLVHSHRPWWDRWLVLDLLNGHDAEFVRGVVVGMCRPYQIPTAKSASSSSAVTLKLYFLTRLTITAAGVEVSRLINRQVTPWDRIDYLRCVLEKASGQPLYVITLHVGGEQTIRGGLSGVGGSSWYSSRDLVVPTWQALIAQLAPAGKWQCFRLSGELTSIAEGEYRLQHWNKWLTFARWFLPLGGISCALLSLWIMWPKLLALWNDPFLPRLWKCIGAACIVLIMVQPTVTLWAVICWQRSQIVSLIATTRQRLAEMSAAANHG